MESSSNFWKKLPNSILISIFKFLDLNDRRNASLTCKAWNNAFKSPKLWSSVEITFAKMKVAQNIINHCHEFIEYLKVQLLSYRDPLHEPYMLMLTDFFLSIIENCTVPQLKTLCLTSKMNPYGFQLNSSPTMDSLTISVTKFLRTQKHLGRLWILWDLTTIHEALLIDAISCNSANSLTLLELNSTKSCVPFNCFPNVLNLSIAQFRNLRWLVLCYGDFGNGTLKTISQNCKLLRSLILEITESFLLFVDWKPHIISSSEWKEATENLPDMKVAFFVYSDSVRIVDKLLWSVDLFAELLPTAVPLNSFSTPTVAFWEAHINYLQNISESLQVLELYCIEETISNVLALLIGCRNLKDLKLVGELPIGIIDFVEQLKRKHFHGLSVVYLLFDEMLPDVVIKVKNRRDLIDQSLKWTLRIFSSSEIHQYREALNTVLF